MAKFDVGGGQASAISSVKINDGREHLIKIFRNRAEITLTVDNLAPIKAKSPDNDFTVFNSQSYVTIGGKVELGTVPLKSFKNSISANVGSPIQARPFFKSLYPFQGTVTGLVFNKRRLLDNIKDGSGYVQGDVVLKGSDNVLAGVGLDRIGANGKVKNSKNNGKKLSGVTNGPIVGNAVEKQFGKSPEKPFTLPSYNKTIKYTITEAIKTTSTPITPRNAVYPDIIDTNLTTMKLPENNISDNQDYDYGSCDYPSCAGKVIEKAVNFVVKTVKKIEKIKSKK